MTLYPLSTPPSPPPVGYLDHLLPLSEQWPCLLDRRAFGRVIGRTTLGGMTTGWRVLCGSDVHPGVLPCRVRRLDGGASC